MVSPSSPDPSLNYPASSTRPYLRAPSSSHQRLLPWITRERTRQRNYLPNDEPRRRAGELHTTLAADDGPQYNAPVAVPNRFLSENLCRAKRRHRRDVNPWSRQRLVKTSRSSACFIWGGRMT